MKGSLVRVDRQIRPLLLVLVLAACSSNPLDSLNPFSSKEDESLRGTIGFVQGVIGGVTTDEPKATLIGRDVLSSGGTAADAAVAVAFALSVTLPSSANLGGGGVCLVRDAPNNITETLNFLPLAPKNISPNSTYPVAVPGFVRGLATLHSKYGKLNWKQLVSPAEALARFGNQVSRAFAHDLKQLGPLNIADPSLQKMLSHKDGGRFVREGDFLKQLDLSSVLGRIRARGGGDFYNGPLAGQIVAAIKKAGGSLSLEQLRAFLPRWTPTLEIPYFQSTKFHFPMMPGSSGVLAAQIMAMTIKMDEWKDASPADRAHMLAEGTGRAYAARARWLNNDGLPKTDPAQLISEAAIEKLLTGFQLNQHVPVGNAGTSQAINVGKATGTSFVVVDREGSAVACSLTLNNLFGIGRIADGTGILLAAIPGPQGRGPDSLSLMLLINEVHNIFYFAGAASGGIESAGALATIGIRAIMGKEDENLEGAFYSRRLVNAGTSDVTHYEQGMDESILKDLANRGHHLSPAPAMGFVNAIFCSSGLPVKKELSCSMNTDPRGFGLASGAE